MNEHELIDRVSFCVVKANCQGPSFNVSEGLVYTAKWQCRQCGGYVLVNKDEVPMKDKRIIGG